MAAAPVVKPASKQAPARILLDVSLGKAEKPLGRLIFVKDGQREFSQSAYATIGWRMLSFSMSRPTSIAKAAINCASHRPRTTPVSF